jgi:RNA polymerase sigma-70 factor, ECF subfamily
MGSTIGGRRLPPGADGFEENRSGCSSVHPPSTLELVRTDEPGSDRALMADFAARQERAADVLYGRFASRIYGLGVVMLGNDQAAQDLVQDTFVKLWRNAERYDPQRGRLETWVLLTARSLAIDALRRRVIESRSLQIAGVQPEDDPEPLPDEQAAVADLSARARRAMDVLSPQQRSALELAYFGGRTTAEVAALEGIPQGTVKTRIRAALLRLRAEMAKEADHDV